MKTFRLLLAISFALATPAFGQVLSGTGLQLTPSSSSPLPPSKDGIWLDTTLRKPQWKVFNSTSMPMITQTSSYPNIADTVVSGLVLRNPTASTAGTPIQRSPAIDLQGARFDGAVSQESGWRIQSVSSTSFTNGQIFSLTPHFGGSDGVGISLYRRTDAPQLWLAPPTAVGSFAIQSELFGATAASITLQSGASGIALRSNGGAVGTPYINLSDLIATIYPGLNVQGRVNAVDVIIGGVTKPTCNSSVRGDLYITRGGAGVQDLPEVCLKLADDTYTWAAYTTSVASAGAAQTIEVDLTSTAGNFDSVTVIPSGAVVKHVATQVTSIYDGAATITVIANGSVPVTLQTSTENTPSIVDLYDNQPFTTLGATGTGKVRVILGGAPSIGAAKVFVTYVTPLL